LVTVGISLPWQLAWQAPVAQRSALARQIWAALPHVREHGPPAQTRLSVLQDFFPVHCVEQAWSPGQVTLRNEQLSSDSHDTLQCKPGGQASVAGLPAVPPHCRSALQWMKQVPSAHSSHSAGQAALAGAAAAGQPVAALEPDAPRAASALAPAPPEPAVPRELEPAAPLPASRTPPEVLRRLSASSEPSGTQVATSPRLAHTQPGRHGQGRPSSEPRSKSETHAPPTKANSPGIQPSLRNHCLEGARGVVKMLRSRRRTARARSRPSAGGRAAARPDSDPGPPIRRR